MFGENWMGIGVAETRMTEHVQASGRNYLLDWITDGTVRHSCFTAGWNAMPRERGYFNCDLRPDQG